MADESRTVTNSTAGLAVNSDYDVAVDTIAGKDYQRVKLDAGADGVATPVVAGQQTAANSLPVVLASDQTAVPVSGTITTNSEYAEDSGHVSTNKGQFVLGVRNDSGTNLTSTDLDYSPIATTIKGAVQVNVSSTYQDGNSSGALLKAESGAAANGDYGVAAYGVSNPNYTSRTTTDQYGAIALTNFGSVFASLDANMQGSTASPVRKEDAAFTSADGVMMAGGYRNDAAAVVTDTDGDVSTISVDSRGRPLTVVHAVNSGGASAQLGWHNEDDAHSSGNAGVMALTVNNASFATFASTGDYIPIGTGRAGNPYCTPVVDDELAGTRQATKIEDQPSLNNDAIIGIGAVRRDTPSTTTTLDGNWTTLTTDASNRLWTRSVITDGTDNAEVEAPGTYNVGLAAATKGIANMSRSHQIWDASHPDNASKSAGDGNWYAQNQESNGNLCTNISSVRGELLRYRNATGSTASGTNPPPLWVGGAAATVTPSSVTAGRAVDGYWSKSGHLCVYLNSVREQDGDQLTTFTSTTAVTTIVTADATYMNDLTGLIFSNKSATGTEVILYNDDGTTERARFYVPATDTRGVVFGKPFKQTAINKAWKAKTVTSVDSVYITAQFSKQL